MKLPYRERAFVETQKITAYLLSEENSAGKEEAPRLVTAYPLEGENR